MGGGLCPRAPYEVDPLKCPPNRNPGGAADVDQYSETMKFSNEILWKITILSKAEARMAYFRDVSIMRIRYGRGSDDCSSPNQIAVSKDWHILRYYKWYTPLENLLKSKKFVKSYIIEIVVVFSTTLRKIKIHNHFVGSHRQLEQSVKIYIEGCLNSVA